MYVKENVTLKMGGKSYIELSVLLTSIEFITMKNFLIREKLDKIYLCNSSALSSKTYGG